MATKEVKVIINGEEFVSKAAKSAEEGVQGFFSKAKGWISGAADLSAAWGMIKGAFGALKDVVLDSFDAFDRYTASQNKMAAQSKLTGVPLEDLRAAAKRAREEFGLGSTVANDAATTVSKYAARAGDATQSNKLLAAALNLGAASGLDAAASMDALEQGLRGQDEGFDKLLGKNPSALWKEYADANGLAVGKMTDTQKRMAELTAVVEAGEQVQGAYNARLEGGAGQQELLNNQIENMMVRMGAALQPIRILVIQGLMLLLDCLVPVVEWAAKAGNAVGIYMVEKFHQARIVGAAIAGVIGKLTGNKELESWAKTQGDASKAAIASIATTVEKATNATVKTYGTASKAAVAHTKTTEGELKKQDKAFKDYLRDIETTQKLVTAQYDRLKKGLEQLDVAAAKALDKERLVLWNAAADKMKEAGDDAFSKITDKALESLSPLEALGSKLRTAGVDMETVARGALDAAQAFGIMDRDAAAALGSVINVGAAIGKLAGGDIVGGISGILGGVANIVSVMVGGDTERRRLLKENSTQLGRLRDEIGNLSLDVTGKDFNAATTALQSIVPQLKGGHWNMPTNLNALMQGLGKAGLSLDKLEDIAKMLGIQIRDKDGNIKFETLPQLLQALGLTEFGRFGTDYSSQKQATEAGFDVNKTSDAGQISALAGLGAAFSPVLKGIFDANDLGGSRTRLAALFQRLNDGGVSAGEMGGLTGSQFMDLLLNLIGRIDGLKEDGAAPGAGAGTTASDSATINVPGVGTVPVSVAADIPAALQAQTDAITPFLEEANGYHRRTADAVERSADTLERIDGRIARLENGGFIEFVDRGLAARRAIAAASSGPRF